MSAHDFKTAERYSLSGTTARWKGMTYVLRIARFRSVDGLSPPARIYQVCQTLPRRLSHQQFFLPRSISLHGIRATDLPRKSPRHRNLLAGLAAKTVSRWIPQHGRSQYACQCQSATRLADLRRLCSSIDRSCEEVVPTRRHRFRVRANRLRLRFHHHRSLFVVVSVGQVSPSQGCGQTAYLDRFTGQYPVFYSLFHGKSPRRQRPRSSDIGARRVLHDGSRLRRLRAVVPFYGTDGVLRHPRQIQYEIQAAKNASRGQIHRPAKRLPHRAQRFAVRVRLSSADTSRRILRHRTQKTVGVSDQQLELARVDYRSVVQASLASGIVFQMDQATPADQGVLWHDSQRRTDPNMDFHQRLCFGRHRQKGTASRIQHVSNLTNPSISLFEKVPIQQALTSIISQNEK